jgi:transcriptional pleiotropic regulator of transition state genes
MKGDFKMRGIGLVRRLDEVGRITLPAEMRDLLGFGYRELLEITLVDNKLIIQKKSENDKDIEKEKMLLKLKDILDNKQVKSVVNDEVVEKIDSWIFKELKNLNEF